MNLRNLFRLVLVLAAVLTAPLRAQEEAPSVIDRWMADPSTLFDASEVDLDALEYIARPLIVFADSPNQPQFRDQIALLQQGIADLQVRDVILIVDSDPDARSDIRRALRPRGFSLVLIDKDGTVVFRKADPWTVREIWRQIEKLPSRIQEIRDGTGTLVGLGATTTP